MSLDYDEKLIGNPRTGVVHSGVTPRSLIRSVVWW